MIYEVEKKRIKCGKRPYFIQNLKNQNKKINKKQKKPRIYNFHNNNNKQQLNFHLYQHLPFIVNLKRKQILFM